MVSQKIPSKKSTRVWNSKNSNSSLRNVVTGPNFCLLLQLSVWLCPKCQDYEQVALKRKLMQDRPISNREKGRTTHCTHGVFIIKSSFTKFVNMFSFFRPMTKRVFHPLMSFSAIFKLYQVTNAFLNSNIKLQRDI